MHKTLIIVNGHPGSGKTTLARLLGQRYLIPYVSKDAIKEHIFDLMGGDSKDWSHRASAVAHRVMDDIIEQQLQCDGNVIVESNFKQDIDSKRFQRFCSKYDANCIQILCQADGDVLFRRWNARIADGTRHQGHVEEIGLEQIRQDLSLPYIALDLPGSLITVDTSEADGESIIRQIDLSP